jgi:hypothetical protein
MFMPSDLKEAERMLDLFTSVGARPFVVTKTDIEQKLIWGKSYSAAELRDKLPAMVHTAALRKPHQAARRHHRDNRRKPHRQADRTRHRLRPARRPERRTA